VQIAAMPASLLYRQPETQTIQRSSVRITPARLRENDRSTVHPTSGYQLTPLRFCKYRLKSHLQQTMPAAAVSAHERMRSLPTNDPWAPTHLPNNVENATCARLACRRSIVVCRTGMQALQATFNPKWTRDQVSQELRRECVRTVGQRGCLRSACKTFTGWFISVYQAR